jgi:hypothetical protein
MISLYDSIVIPTLNYAAEVWGHDAGLNLEIIHTIFCCVKQSTNVDVLYGEFGRTPMFIHRKLICIKYWIKRLKLNERTILCNIYIKPLLYNLCIILLLKAIKGLLLNHFNIFQYKTS